MTERIAPDIIKRPVLVDVPYAYPPIIPEPAGLTELAGPEPIKVVLSAKRRDMAFGDPGATENIPVDWPADWRIPMPGDSVHLRKDWGGIVSGVDFDLGEGVVRVFIR